MSPSLAELLQHAGWTRRLARGLLGSDVAADDVVQDTWLAALRRPPDAGRPLRPWLGTVVRNKVVNRTRERARRNAREARADDGDGSESPESLLGRLEMHKILVDVVSELAEPYRQTILLAYFEELSSAAIGERSNVPASTVRGRLKTALELLREALDARLGGRSEWRSALTDLLHLPRSPARAEPLRTRASTGSGGAVSGGAGGGVSIAATAGLVALVAAATIWSVTKHMVPSQQSAAAAKGGASVGELDERAAPSPLGGQVTVPSTAQPLRVVFRSEPSPWVTRSSWGSCTIALGGAGPIAKACASGGRDAAKKLMKELVKQAKSRGDRFTCEGCHRNLEDFDLTASARDDLEKLVVRAQYRP